MFFNVEEYLMTKTKKNLLKIIMLFLCSAALEIAEFIKAVRASVLYEVFDFHNPYDISSESPLHQFNDNSVGLCARI